jgi:phosphoribosylamine--glycine ligase
MKFLVIDEEGDGVDISLRAQDAGHEVRYWVPNGLPYGDGMFEKPKDWKPSMDWAELILIVSNKEADKYAEYFGKGYPIFGTNPKAAKLELDRGFGQKILKEYGITTLPYKVVGSADEGVAFIAKTGKAYAMKPWGGNGDKSMTCLGDTPEDCIFTLQKWKKENVFDGQLMLQEKVEGVEMGISGFFGPGGWLRALEESFEHKKLMNDEKGPNTGEMGTVIRHVSRSKLFDMVLEPLTDYLHSCRYVGDCSVNCIIDKRGTPYPLEFTMRLGWPDYAIRQEVIQSDPIEWMVDLLYGRDTLKVSSATVVGVLIAHGDFPHECDPKGYWEGFPISGIDEDTYPHLHFQQVKDGRAPMLMDGKLKEVAATVTAGNYPIVVTGSGGTVSLAAERAYKTVSKIHWPSYRIFRTDIGGRLEKELPLIQAHGFAEGMEY